MFSVCIYNAAILNHKENEYNHLLYAIYAAISVFFYLVWIDFICSVHHMLFSITNFSQ